MADVVNYPDILGQVTQAERLNIGMVQAALALRPKQVRAGRPFEVLMLIQNAADCPIDLTVVLHLPDQDAKKQKNKFIAKVNRLVVGVQPAEVGYVVLPVTTLPDTASAPGYKIAVELSAKQQGEVRKVGRVRLPNGGGAVGNLRPELVEQLESLKDLSFTSEKRGMLRSAIELTFNLLPGKLGSLADLKPGWVSLWTLQDLQAEPTNLLARYAEDLKTFLHNIDPVQTYKALHDRTLKRFEEAGYPLKLIEANLITRLMTLVLEYASTNPNGPDKSQYPVAPEFEVNKILEDDIIKSDQTLPNWVNPILRAIGQDKRAVQFPGRAVAYFAYDDLLRDAVLYGLQRVEAVTGESLGETEEKIAHSQQVIDGLNRKSSVPLDFSLVYLPLVMAGALTYEHVTIPKEDEQAIRDGLANILLERKPEMDEDNAPIFALAKTAIDTALMKYGFKSEL